MKTKSVYLTVSMGEGGHSEPSSMTDQPVWSIVEQTIESDPGVRQFSERVLASGLTLDAAHKHLCILGDCVLAQMSSNWLTMRKSAAQPGSSAA